MLLTCAVVAIWVVFTVVAAVGAVGVPVKAGLAVFAFPLTADVTNAVVAIWVVFVPAVAVGAVGDPVNAGLANTVVFKVNAGAPLDPCIRNASPLGEAT